MKLLKAIFSVYAMTIFLALMLVVFVLSLASLFMGRMSGGNYVYRICSYWSDVWFFFIFIKTKKIDAHLFDDEKKYIVVPNHISYLDIPVLVNVFRKPLRPLAKVEMAKLPVFGLIYSKVAVTVDRSNAQNRERSVSILKAVIKKGISILVFPEGTFNMTHQPLKEFYNGAFRIALETQTPIKPVLFLDTFDRMNYSSVFSINPGICRVVYLPEIEVEGLTLDDLDSLKEKTYNAMEQKLIEYKAAWIK